MRLPSFASVRITLLLGFLIVTALVSAHQRTYSRNWNQTLTATVFPINGDGHLATDHYINSLETRHFQIIDRWAEREAERHGLDLRLPVKVTLGEQIHTQPPRFPSDNANSVDVLWWGLRFRWWAFRHTPDDDGGVTRVRLFVMYYEGEEGVQLAHSLGMQKGLMGLVHAFATHEQTAQNNIVIAHELLHTVGATDKYEAGGLPLFPAGYANAARQPLFPQRSAEIMAGSIPTSRSSAYMAESLKSVVINPFTAVEINWIQ